MNEPGAEDERGAELLRLLLEGSGDEGALGEADERERLELEAFLARARGVLGEDAERLAPLRERALGERVLEASSRAPLDWRARRQVFGRVLAEGLRSSALMRLAAASLLLHLAALPVLAWMVWGAVEEERALFISPGLDQVAPRFEEDQELEHELGALEASAEVDSDRELDPWWPNAEQTQLVALRVARERLQSQRGLLDGLGAPTSSLGRVLLARVRGWAHDEPLALGAGELEAVSAEEARLIELVLGLAALERYVIHGEPFTVLQGQQLDKALLQAGSQGALGQLGQLLHAQAIAFGRKSGIEAQALVLGRDQAELELRALDEALAAPSDDPVVQGWRAWCAAAAR